MKTTSKIIISILSITIIWRIYIYFTFPNMDKIKDNLKTTYSENITPDKLNYENLVKNDLKENRTILIGKAKSSKIFNHSFPFSTHKFELNETEKILKILNDSTNYDWGEIGTAYYDKILVFYDENQNEIGYVNLSLDGEIDIFPNLPITKWGLLSKKGFRELIIAVRTE